MRIDNSDNNKSGIKKLVGKRLFSKRTMLFLFLIVAVIAFYFISPKVKSKGYSGIWDFVSTVTSNYFDGRKATPEEISIEIKDNDYKKLEKNRKQALERGVIINDMDGEYVSATIMHNGKKIDVKLRLKGHMTDHLQNDKWSFRIKTKGNDDFMGMKRFSIQHPGTRGYIYEWIYHELMKREDVIALRYKFINVKVNGKDWGIYAVEENFENELIDNNNRKKGPILRFNPDLYWVHRYNMMTKESSNDEYASYYSANPEAYRESKVLEDTVQKKYYLKAIGLIEGLRSRKVSVEQAFDIPLLAKFHAIIDLVGGTHSIDWSDIKYYYNPVTGLLEPVAYESFTNLESRSLSGLYKYSSPDSTSNYEDWHEMIFSNKTFFTEYIKQLERISNVFYLNEFFNSNNDELNKNLAIIHKEFPYKKFDKTAYYKRQKMIAKIIDSPKPLHAYFKKAEGNKIHIQLGAIDALPVLIKSISVNGVVSESASSVVLPSKQTKEYVNYKDYTFVMPASFSLSKSAIDSLIIQYSILGSSKVKESKIFAFPHSDSEFIEDDLKNKESTLSDFQLLNVDEENKIIHLKAGRFLISSDLIIPAGYKFLVQAGSIINITNKAKIISYSPCLFEGNEDNYVVLESSDSSSQGIQIINAAKSIFKFVTFKNLPKIKDTSWARTGALTFYESPVDFTNCSFSNSKAEDAVNIIRSDFSFNVCQFYKMENDAVDIDFSEGTFTNCIFGFCNENAIDITKGNVKFKSIYVYDIGNKSINVKEGSQIFGDNVKIRNSNIGISVEDFSSVDLKNGYISDCEIGIAAFKNKSGAGYPTVKLTALQLTNVKTNYLKEKKSSINANGIEIEEETKDVEALIKNDKKKHK